MECHCVLIHDLNALHLGHGGDVAEIGIGVCKLKICLDCLCIERRPIVERDALFQMEGQSSSVIGKLPALRQAGDDLPVFIVDKALITELCADIVLHIHVEGIKGVQLRTDRRGQDLGFVLRLARGRFLRSGRCFISTAACQRAAEQSAAEGKRKQSLFHGLLPFVTVLCQHGRFARLAS